MNLKIFRACFGSVTPKHDGRKLQNNLTPMDHLARPSGPMGSEFSVEKYLDDGSYPQLQQSLSRTSYSGDWNSDLDCQVLQRQTSEEAVQKVPDMPQVISKSQTPSVDDLPSDYFDLPMLISSRMQQPSKRTLQDIDDAYVCVHHVTKGSTPKQVVPKSGLQLYSSILQTLRKANELQKYAHMDEELASETPRQDVLFASQGGTKYISPVLPSKGSGTIPTYRAASNSVTRAASNSVMRSRSSGLNLDNYSSITRSRSSGLVNYSSIMRGITGGCSFSEFVQRRQHFRESIARSILRSPSSQLP